MAKFADALAFVLPHEGGYSNRPNDAGGETMYGITVATARRNGYLGPMRDLPLSVAADIYEREYWPGLDQIENQAVAAKILDIRVNSGVEAGNRIAQLAANTLVEPPTPVDGRWGPDTVLTINSADPAGMLQALADLSAQRYQHIAQTNPSQMEFLKGWLKRALDLPPLTTTTGILLLLGLAAVIFIATSGGRRAG